MKRIKFAGLFLGIFLLLAGCKKENPEILDVIEVTAESIEEWREQLELGLRYLLEQQYEEAIVAFTSVINIEPKCMEAYKGRGDAYYALVIENQESNGEVLIAETPMLLQDLIVNAQSDYQEVLSLLEEANSEISDDFDMDPADIYHKLADLSMILGDLLSSLEFLQAGNEKYPDSGFQERIVEVQEEMDSVLLSQELYDADGNLMKSYQYTYDENNYLVRMGECENNLTTGELEEIFFVTWEMVKELDDSGWDEWILDSGPGPENSAPTEYHYPGGRTRGTDNWWYDDSAAICSNPYPEEGIQEVITNTWAQENGFAEAAWYTAHYTQDTWGNAVQIDSYDKDGNLLGYCKNVFRFYQKGESTKE